MTQQASANCPMPTRVNRVTRRSVLSSQLIRSCALLLTFVGASCCYGASITLKNAFIEQYADRATITATDCILEQAHKKPNPPQKDGDLHIAVHSEKIGL